MTSRAASLVAAQPIAKNHRVASAALFLKRCIAIGIVLARPDKNKDQPRALRFDCLNLSASRRPAPNPMAPRVAAINAICGTVTVLSFESVIFTL
jgi:hypothetical protein